jgi:hypothetical protein
MLDLMVVPTLPGPSDVLPAGGGGVTGLADVVLAGGGGVTDAAAKVGAVCRGSTASEVETPHPASSSEDARPTPNPVIRLLSIRRFTLDLPIRHPRPDERGTRGR